MRVAIYSAHGLLQEGLKQLVVAVGFIVSPPEHAEVALSDLSSDRPMPSPPALPTLAVIYTGDRRALEVLRAGYRGYVHEKHDRNGLRDALSAVGRGEIWAERHVLGRAFEVRRAPRLTAREREVLSFVARGLSNKDVARQLDITENTVKGYVSKLLDKFELKNRAEIIVAQHSERL